MKIYLYVNTYTWFETIYRFVWFFIYFQTKENRNIGRPVLGLPIFFNLPTVFFTLNLIILSFNKSLF